MILKTLKASNAVASPSAIVRARADPRISPAGLDSMRERATELGGSFSIEARPAGGTLVRALLPTGPLTPAAGDAPPPSGVLTETSTGDT